MEIVGDKNDENVHVRAGSKNNSDEYPIIQVG